MEVEMTDMKLLTRGQREELERLAQDWDRWDLSDEKLIRYGLTVLLASARRLEELEGRIRAVVPYVIATLPKPHDGSPEGPNPDWGCAHRGRSASSVRQLRGLLDACGADK